MGSGRLMPDRPTAALAANMSGYDLSRAEEVRRRGKFTKISQTMAHSDGKFRIGGSTADHVTPRSNYSHIRPVLSANARRQRRLEKHLHRKAIRYFLAMVAFALLSYVIFRGPVGVGVAPLFFGFGGWRYIVNRQQMDFLREAPISLGETLLSKFRLKRSVYRAVMSYTFEGRTYSNPQEIHQADHAAVLSREISLYALFDYRTPGKMLSYRAGSVVPRWLKSRSEKGGAGDLVAQRPRLAQLGAEERKEVGVDR